VGIDRVEGIFYYMGRAPCMLRSLGVWRSCKETRLGPRGRTRWAHPGKSKNCPSIIVQSRQVCRGHADIHSGEAHVCGRADKHTDVSENYDECA
jgi:hypothetical protein